MENRVLYIVMPAYNEEANIRKTVADWYPVVEQHNETGKSRLVIVDDGSKDATYEILCQCQKDFPLLVPLTKPNGGHGAAVLYSYRYAIAHGADLIFQTDSDGQTNPAEFPAFWDAMESYDVAIGTRKVRGDGKSRKFVENVVCLLLWLVFGIRVSDANAPFRLMRADLVEKYIRKMPEDFNLPNIMLTTYFAYFKEKITFIDISFKPRQGGKNSINIRRIIKIGWKAMFDFVKLRKEINE